MQTLTWHWQTRACWASMPEPTLPLCWGPLTAASPVEQLMLAFGGALVASLIVALPAARAVEHLSPVRLTLARRMALAAVLEGLSSGISLLNADV